MPQPAKLKTGRPIANQPKPPFLCHCPQTGYKTEIDPTEINRLQNSNRRYASKTPIPFAKSDLKCIFYEAVRPTAGYILRYVI